MKNTKHVTSDQFFLSLLILSFILFALIPIFLISATAQACQTEWDCLLGQVCNQGNCISVQCDQKNNGADCPYAENACISKSCQSISSDDDLGNAVCVEERIEGVACAFDRDCGSQDLCNTQTCECEPAQPPSQLCSLVDCDDHNSCTSDSCNEGTGKCRHVKIENCPVPPPPVIPSADPPLPDSPKVEAIPTVNPCVSSFQAQGVDPELANSLMAQGICSLSLTGQSARACSLAVGPGVSPWSMLFPLIGGIGWMCSRRGFRKQTNGRRTSRDNSQGIRRDL